MPMPKTFDARAKLRLDLEAIEATLHFALHQHERHMIKVGELTDRCWGARNALADLINNCDTINGKRGN